VDDLAENLVDDEQEPVASRSNVVAFCAQAILHDAEQYLRVRQGSARDRFSGHKVERGTQLAHIATG